MVTRWMEQGLEQRATQEAQSLVLNYSTIVLATYRRPKLAKF